MAEGSSYLLNLPEELSSLKINDGSEPQVVASSNTLVCDTNVLAINIVYPNVHSRYGKAEVQKRE